MLFRKKILLFMLLYMLLMKDGLVHIVYGKREFFVMFMLVLGYYDDEANERVLLHPAPVPSGRRFAAREISVAVEGSCGKGTGECARSFFA